MAQTERPHIAEMVIDPKWNAGTVTINGTQHAFLQIEHPRHGKLAFLIPWHELTNLTATLEKIAESTLGKKPT